MSSASSDLDGVDRDAFEDRRRHACRLDPRFALSDLDDAVAFLHDRGLLTLTTCCSVPSLFGACHEEPHSPGKAGYGQYPKTRWWWGGALAASPGVTATKLHRGKGLFLSARLVDLVAPLCLESLRRAEEGDLGEDAMRVVEFLGDVGAATTDEAKIELRLDAGAFRRARAVLERHGAVLANHITIDAGTGHRHESELRVWDRRPKSVPAEPLLELLVSTVAAAVILPVKEARQALTWTIPPEVVDRAVERGRLTRLPGDLLAAG